VIKMVLAVRAGILPPTLHVGEPSPHVDWSAGGGAVRLLTEPRDWPDEGRPRRAGVSSFGVSGTNAHVILEGLREPQGREAPRRRAGETLPWVVSGRGTDALRAQAQRLAALARSGAGDAGAVDVGAVDVGWSLVSGRAMFEDRAVVLARDVAGFAAGMDAVAAGRSAEGVVTGRVPDGGAGKVAFVFAGQGSQRSGMGRVLAEAFPVFAEAVGEVCGLLGRLLGVDVRAAVFAGPGTAVAGAVDQTMLTQAGLFAVQVGLTRLLGSWGITPDYVTGHSIGEITAAHVAGMLSLEDACALVATRGRLMQALGGGGAMAAVAAPEAEVAGWLGQAGITGAVVAAVNGPSSVVVSGAAGSVAAAGRYFRGEGVRVRRLRTSHAFHSPLVEPMLGELGAVAAGLSFREPKIPVVCSVTGAPDAGLMGTAGYWVRQAREAVRFADCVRWLAGAGAGVLAELGGDGSLSALGGDSGVWVPVLRARRAEPESALSAAAGVFVRGVEVDWAAVFDEPAARRVALPTYAFQHQRYWPVPRPGAGNVAAAGLWTAGHPLLAAGVGLAGDDGAVFTGVLSVAAFPWLADHAVFGMVLMPGTAFVELAAWMGGVAGSPRVEELTLEAPLVLPDQGGVQVQLRISGPEGASGRVVSLYSRADEGQQDNSGWVRHASGTLATADPALAGSPAGTALAGQWPPAGAVPVLDEGLYERLALEGYGYGPAFQGLAAVWRREDEVFAEVRLPQELHADSPARASEGSCRSRGPACESPGRVCRYSGSGCARPARERSRCWPPMRAAG
jgi:acyl transferase domain-containing protein